MDLSSLAVPEGGWGPKPQNVNKNHQIKYVKLSGVFFLKTKGLL